MRSRVVNVIISSYLAPPAAAAKHEMMLGRRRQQVRGLGLDVVARQARPNCHIHSHSAELHAMTRHASDVLAASWVALSSLNVLLVHYRYSLSLRVNNLLAQKCKTL